MELTSRFRHAALLLWFIAIAFPFYGLINSIIGALTGSMVSFILPALAYNLYYMRSAAARANAPKQPPRYSLPLAANQSAHSSVRETTVGVACVGGPVFTQGAH